MMVPCRSLPDSPALSLGDGAGRGVRRVTDVASSLALSWPSPQPSPSGDLCIISKMAGGGGSDATPANLGGPVLGFPLSRE